MASHADKGLVKSKPSNCQAEVERLKCLLQAEVINGGNCDDKLIGLLAHFPCEIQHKYVNFNIMQLLHVCTTRTIDFEQLSCALSVLAKYSLNLLKDLEHRPAGWTKINFNCNIFRQTISKIPGACDVLKCMGYTSDINNGLEFSPSSAPDTEALAKLSIELLAARLEVDLYLHGEHNNPEFLDELLTGSSSGDDEETKLQKTVSTDQPISLGIGLQCFGDSVSTVLNEELQAVTCECDICGHTTTLMWQCCATECVNKLRCDDCNKVWHKHPLRRHHQPSPWQQPPGHQQVNLVEELTNDWTTNEPFVEHLVQQARYSPSLPPPAPTVPQSLPSEPPAVPSLAPCSEASGPAAVKLCSSESTLITIVDKSKDLIKHSQSAVEFRQKDNHSSITVERPDPLGKNCSMVEASGYNSSVGGSDANTPVKRTVKVEGCETEWRWICSHCTMENTVGESPSKICEVCCRTSDVPLLFQVSEPTGNLRLTIPESGIISPPTSSTTPDSRANKTTPQHHSNSSSNGDVRSKFVEIQDQSLKTLSRNSERIDKSKSGEITGLSPGNGNGQLGLVDGNTRTPGHRQSSNDSPSLGQLRHTSLSPGQHADFSASPGNGLSKEQSGHSSLLETSKAVLCDKLPTDSIVEHQVLLGNSQHANTRCHGNPARQFPAASTLLSTQPARRPDVSSSCQVLGSQMSAGSDNVFLGSPVIHSMSAISSESFQQEPCKAYQSKFCQLQHIVYCKKQNTHCSCTSQHSCCCGSSVGASGSGLVETPISISPGIAKTVIGPVVGAEGGANTIIGQDRAKIVIGPVVGAEGGANTMIGQDRVKTVIGQAVGAEGGPAIQQIQAPISSNSKIVRTANAGHAAGVVSATEIEENVAKRQQFIKNCKLLFSTLPMQELAGFVDSEFETIVELCGSSNPLDYFVTDWMRQVQQVISRVKAHGILGCEWLPEKLVRSSLAACGGNVESAVDLCSHEWTQQMLQLMLSSLPEEADHLCALLHDCDGNIETFKVARIREIFTDNIWKPVQSPQTAGPGSPVTAGLADPPVQGLATLLAGDGGVYDENQRHIDDELMNILNGLKDSEQERERCVRMMLAEAHLAGWLRAQNAVDLLDNLPPADGDSSRIYLIDVVEAVRVSTHSLDQCLRYLQQECVICSCFYPPRMIQTLSCCECKLCRDCVRQHFEVVIREQYVRRLICPSCQLPDIDGNSEQTDNHFQFLTLMLKKLLSDKDYGLLQEKLRDWRLKMDPCFRWCAFNNCKYGFLIDPNQMKVQCNSCNRFMCQKCQKPWEEQHTGRSCEAFLDWKKANDPEFQLQGLARHLEENGIECPQCNMRYSLAKGGCMHFTCTECHYEFCSGCLQAFKRDDVSGLVCCHPRNCLYFLRDCQVEDLQLLLRNHKVLYNTECSTSEINRIECNVMEQKQIGLGGYVDQRCGKPVPAYFAGLCESHYKEYLVSLINRNDIDPVTIMTTVELLALAQREKLVVPQQNRQLDQEYRGILIQFVQQNSPLKRKERNSFTGRR